MKNSKKGRRSNKNDEYDFADHFSDKKKKGRKENWKGNIDILPMILTRDDSDKKDKEFFSENASFAFNENPEIIIKLNDKEREKAAAIMLQCEENINYSRALKKKLLSALISNKLKLENEYVVVNLKGESGKFDSRDIYDFETGIFLENQKILSAEMQNTSLFTK